LICAPQQTLASLVVESALNLLIHVVASRGQKFDWQLTDQSTNHAERVWLF
jgi:hypothetical protein